MPELVALLIVIPALGAAIGYVFANDRTRRAAGGKSPAQLREEFEEYRAGVNAHFQETATLLDGVTEQYRAVYAHMAKGAFDFCDSANAGPRLEQLQSVLKASDPGVVEVHSPDANVEAHQEPATEIAPDASVGPAPSIKTVSDGEPKVTERDGGAIDGAEEQENRPAA